MALVRAQRELGRSATLARGRAAARAFRRRPRGSAAAGRRPPGRRRAHPATSRMPSSASVDLGPTVRLSAPGASAPAPRGGPPGGTGRWTLASGRFATGWRSAGTVRRCASSTAAYQPAEACGAEGPAAFGPLVTSHRYACTTTIPQSTADLTGAPVPADTTDVTSTPASPAEPGRGAHRVRVIGLTRRGFLRVAGLTGGGLVAAASPPARLRPPPPGASAPRPPAARPRPPRQRRHRSRRRPHRGRSAGRPSASAAPSPRRDANIPAGWTEHDVDARDVVRRYLGNLAPALKGIYGDAGVRQARRDPRRRRRLPGARREAGVRPGPAARPQRRPHAAQARDGRRRQGLQPDDRRDLPADRRAEAPVAALGYNKQWPGPTIRVDRGRQGPRRLHEQPQGDDRRPLPRRGVRRTSSRTASRSSPSCRSPRARRSPTSSRPAGPAR